MSAFHSLYARIFRLWRVKRFALFVKLVEPSPKDLLLDVGGFPGFWAAQDVVKRVDTLNVEPVPWDPARSTNCRISTTVGDGCALTAADRSYDIAYSNSVIEHVGSWERQQKFASEIRRVGNAIWVQTPAYECPFEPHYLAPFVHYLPKAAQKKLIRWFTLRGWLDKPSSAKISQIVDANRLLSRREFATLFPDCTILTECLLGVIPKSYIAFRRKNAP